MSELMPSVSEEWSSRRIAQAYLSFFERNGHMRIPGRRLTMQENATSFIIAGMQPLMPYFSGVEVPPSPRLTSLQRCLRTDDVEMVGRNSSQDCPHFRCSATGPLVIMDVAKPSRWRRSCWTFSVLAGKICG